MDGCVCHERCLNDTSKRATNSITLVISGYSVRITPGSGSVIESVGLFDELAVLRGPNPRVYNLDRTGMLARSLPRERKNSIDFKYSGEEWHIFYLTNSSVL